MPIKHLRRPLVELSAIKTGLIIIMATLTIIVTIIIIIEEERPSAD